MLWPSMWLAPNTMGEDKLVMALACNICSCDTEVQHFPQESLHPPGWSPASPQLGSTQEDAVLTSASPSHASMLLQRPHLPLVTLQPSLKGRIQHQVLLHPPPFPCCLSISLLLPSKSSSPYIPSHRHHLSAPPQLLPKAPTSLVSWGFSWPVCHGLFAMGLLLMMSRWPPHSARLEQPSPSPTCLVVKLCLQTLPPLIWGYNLTVDTWDCSQARIWNHSSRNTEFSYGVWHWWSLIAKSCLFFHPSWILGWSLCCRQAQIPSSFVLKMSMVSVLGCCPLWLWALHGSEIRSPPAGWWELTHTLLPSLMGSPTVAIPSIPASPTREGLDLPNYTPMLRRHQVGVSRKVRCLSTHFLPWNKSADQM